MVKVISSLMKLRVLRGISQQQLAERLGVSRKTVGEWERGDRVPSIRRLLPLAEALGVPVDVVITSVVEMMDVTGIPVIGVGEGSHE